MVGARAAAENRTDDDMPRRPCGRCRPCCRWSISTATGEGQQKVSGQLKQLPQLRGRVRELERDYLVIVVLADRKSCRGYEGSRSC